MKEVEWDIQEVFSFPESLGQVVEVIEVAVSPKWQKEELTDSVRLSGIYHVKATVRLEQGETSAEGILIEELDIGDRGAYFEYAMPLQIDLPKESYQKIDVHVKDTKPDILQSGSLSLGWKVACLLTPEENRIPTQTAVKADAVVEDTEFEWKPSEKSLSEEEPYELDFLVNLPEHYTEAVFQSNKIRP